MENQFIICPEVVTLAYLHGLGLKLVSAYEGSCSQSALASDKVRTRVKVRGTVVV